MDLHAHRHEALATPRTAATQRASKGCAGKFRICSIATSSSSSEVATTTTERAKPSGPRSRCIAARSAGETSLFGPAVAAAMAYARKSADIGVATVTCGPGVTQLITALPAAVRAHLPLVQR